MPGVTFHFYFFKAQHLCYQTVHLYHSVLARTLHLMRMEIFLLEIDHAAHALILHPIDIMLSAVVPSQIVRSGGDKTALVTSKLSNFSAAFYFR